MASPPTLSRPLAALLVLAVFLLLQSAARGLRTPDPAEAMRVLLDGEFDRARQERLLGVLIDDALASDERPRLRTGALAAVVLGDRERYETFTERLGGPLLVHAGEAPADLYRASLGEPVLRQLLEGMIAESRGRNAAAAAAYRRAGSGARLWRMHLARRLARAGTARVTD